MAIIDILGPKFSVVLSKLRAYLTGFISICLPLSTLCWQGTWKLNFIGGNCLYSYNSLHGQSIPWVYFVLTSALFVPDASSIERERHHRSFPLNSAPPGMPRSINLPPPEFYYPWTVTKCQQLCIHLWIKIVLLSISGGRHWDSFGKESSSFILFLKNVFGAYHVRGMKMQEHCLCDTISFSTLSTWEAESLLGENWGHI